MVGQLDLYATAPSGERRPVRVWIGTPVQEPTGEWSCPANLEGLCDDLAAMRGENALQAICLALGLCASLSPMRRACRPGRRSHGPAPCAPWR